MDANVNWNVSNQSGTGVSVLIVTEQGRLADTDMQSGEQRSGRAMITTGISKHVTITLLLKSTDLRGNYIFTIPAAPSVGALRLNVTVPSQLNFGRGVTNPPSCNMYWENELIVRSQQQSRQGQGQQTPASPFSHYKWG